MRRRHSEVARCGEKGGGGLGAPRHDRGGGTGCDGSTTGQPGAGGRGDWGKGPEFAWRGCLEAALQGSQVREGRAGIERMDVHCRGSCY